jgi:AcrR family transcriptional regulator
MPASQRREAIVDAAIDLFSKYGFRGATTRELAAAVGVTEPVLYQHFETKRALYDAILETRCKDHPLHLEQEFDALSEAGDNQALFRRLAELLLDWYLEDPRYARLMMFSALERHELAQLFYERQVVLFYGWITKHLQQQMDQGVFRKLDPMLVARSFAGMIAHHGLIYAIYCPGMIQGSRQAVIETVVNLFLNGIMEPQS